MKRSELFFSFLLVPLDYLMIIFAGVCAYYIRYADFFQEFRPVIFNLELGHYLEIIAPIGVLWIIIFAFSGLYNIKGTRRIIKEFYRVVSACSMGLVLIVIYIFLKRELFDSRFIVLAGWILAIIYLGAYRSLIRVFQRYLYRYGIGVHKVILVGNTKTTDNLIQEFSGQKNSGFEVVKRLRDFSIETAQDLRELIKTKEVDEIIQSDPNISKAETLRMFDFADIEHITFKYAADLLGTKVLKTEVAEIAGIPVVEVKKTPLDGWGRIVKRIFDLLGGGLLIIFFGPLMIITALIIKFDSRGPIFYKNGRVGRAGDFFKLYKFRSMLFQFCTGDDYDKSESAIKYERELISKQNTKNGPVYKISDDPRLTRAGKFIRRWSIDELPQLFNVLLGNMSLVGPRPHQPREVAMYEFHHKKVLNIKPGMTGMGQISGRSDLTFEEEVKLDTYYIENWSLLMDLAILLRTPLAVLKKREVE